MTETTYDQVWRWKKWLGNRHRQPCRILARGLRMNTILVEFDDGYKTITSRYAVRPAQPSDQHKGLFEC